MAKIRGQFCTLAIKIGIFCIGLGTDGTYSPAAIDIAPAPKPAISATKTLLRLDSAAATPTIKLAAETIRR